MKEILLSLSVKRKNDFSKTCDSLKIVVSKVFHVCQRAQQLTFDPYLGGGVDYIDTEIESRYLEALGIQKVDRMMSNSAVVKV